MAENPRRIIYNLYPQPDFSTHNLYLYGNEPALRLDEIQVTERNSAQLERLGATTLPIDDPLFGNSLGWAFRGYIVHRLQESADDAINMPAGSTPPQSVDQETRRRQMEKPRSAERDKGQRICLFNLLVALEWNPSRRYRRRLEWAFQRASDFLYDVSDGSMAFGQVVFGGPEMMDCADFQIMASNRFHPRSWTNGLHDPVKYMPIRGGRGIWHKDNRVSIAWDEPEAYRTIVHEWAHYALSLKDEYLNQEGVKLADTASKLLSYADGQTPEYMVVVPTIRLVVDSIMAALASSELVPQHERRSRRRKKNEWEKLAEKEEFSFLKMKGDHQPLDGPMRLPLPLPHFHHLQEPEALPEQAPRSDGLLLDIPTRKIQADHCWAFVIKGSTADPQQIIPQGSIDARAEQDGFRLLGAHQGDTVVLIGLDRADTPVVLSGVISSTVPEDGELEAVVGSWNDSTPAIFPVVDVIPAPVADGSAAKVGQISVHVSDEGDGLPLRWVFPLGGAPRKPVAAPNTLIDIETLDGYVFIGTADGGRFTISSFSQGGGPGSSPPVSANPTAAGSSEGNVMLFFYDDEQTGMYGTGSRSYRELERAGKDYSSVRVVTTLNHGIAVDGDAQPRSYVFSLASNQALPPLAPTLVMFYDQDNSRDAGNLRIYRHQASGWELVPTYLPPKVSFAAAPLTEATASGLFATDGLRVERYRLCLRQVV